MIDGIMVITHIMMTTTYYPTDQPHTTKKSPFLSLSLSFLDGGVTPLFQTDQQKCNNLKRERDLLEDANVQMIKRLKHSEMCMRNLQNQKSIRAKRSTDLKQARQRFLDACKEYHSPTHSGYVCVVQR